MVKGWSDPHKSGPEIDIREENTYDIIIHNDGLRTGWLFNMKATSVRDPSNINLKRSALYLYFISDDRITTFRTTYVYRPYFYVDCLQDPEKCRQLLALLGNKYRTESVEVQLVIKDDLTLPDHVCGKKKKLIKMLFDNVEQLKTVRADMQNTIQRNKQRRTGRDDDVLKSNAFDVTADPMDWVTDIFEYDVLYLSRVAIDNDLRCGRWYDIKCSANDVKPTQCVVRPDLLAPPPLRVFAWDIEVTKERLKFPDAEKDEVMMISYMVDGHGYLIVNRTIVKEDIEDFSFYPKADIGGEFHIFNVEDERAVLQKFFDHICELKPHIFVTYNGDFFDFPFICRRAQLQEPPMDMRDVIGVSADGQGVFTGRCTTHMDCFAWVERDSYLPCGSRGLKAVTRAKLKYDPVELDPELMQPFAEEQPQQLAAYSVSDAVATYYLYKKFVHDFIFALATIIPMQTDDVLRKGSGTLCEQLLMAEAFRKNILFPNKQKDNPIAFHDNHLIESSTYVGGRVESLLTGVYRSDLPEKFRLDPSAFDMLISKIDSTLHFFLETEAQVDAQQITNIDDVKAELRTQLEELRDRPAREECPLIYHLDVGAMYPNIILSNRLQPTSIATPSTCAQCSYFPQAGLFQCQRHMEWMWRGELFMTDQADYRNIRQQLEVSRFGPKAHSGIVNNTLEDEIHKATGCDAARRAEILDEDSSILDRPTTASLTARSNLLPQDRLGLDGADGAAGGKAIRSWHELSPQEQTEEILKRVKFFSMKAYKRIKKTVTELRTDVVCQRENPFYVDTVRAFRDRRYEYKRKTKEQKNAAEQAAARANVTAEATAKDLCLLYDSLQLAHK